MKKRAGGAGSRKPERRVRRGGGFDWLRQRATGDNGFLSAVELAAAERLRLEHLAAELGARVTMDWDGLPRSRSELRSGPTSGSGHIDRTLAARARMERALAAMGPDLGEVAFEVCCRDIGLGEVERRRGWPLRSGKVVLQLALRQLAVHYGLASSGEAADKPAGIREWRAPDAGSDLSRWK